MYLVDATTGEQLRRVFTAGRVAGTPALTSDRLYFGSMDKGFRAVDTTSGITISTVKYSSRFLSSVTYADGLLYVGTEGGTVAVFSAARGTEGQLVAELAVGGRVAAAPAAEDGYLYVASQNKTLTRFDLGDFM